MHQSAILAHDISKRRGRVTALDGVSLEVKKGQFYALLGANGAGKTTLINCLTTVFAPDGGEVNICGIDARKHPKAVRRKIGVVFQDQSLDAQMTVEENLEFHARIYKMGVKLRRSRIRDMLELAGLEARRHAPVRSLSGGMRRRLEIVRALLHQPEVLFLDEPTVGLDPQSRLSIWRYVHMLRASYDHTLVVTTHYIDEVEQSDCVCILDQGRVIAHDSPDVLRARYGRALIRMTLEPQALEAGGGRDILNAYEGAQLEGRDILVWRATLGEAEQALAEDAMRRWPGQLRRVALEQPTLEAAFIAALAAQS